MYAAKQIFLIALPFTTWRLFLESIGLLAFLFSVFIAWATWRSDKQSSLNLLAARKEGEVAATLEKHNQLLLRSEAVTETLSSLITANSQAIEELHSKIARLNAQVQQTEGEAIFRRRLARVEEKLKKLYDSSNPNL